MKRDAPKRKPRTPCVACFVAVGKTSGMPYIGTACMMALYAEQKAREIAWHISEPYAIEAATLTLTGNPQGKKK